MAMKQFASYLVLWAFPIIAMACQNKDQQGTVYKGLQHLDAFKKIMADQGINWADTTQRWEVGEKNLIHWLLAPWEEAKVIEAIEILKKQHSSVREAALSIFSETLRQGLFEASGTAITEESTAWKQMRKSIEEAAFLESFDTNTRAITIEDADALFVPSSVFLTKDLTKIYNVAANQKSSSTLITRNTPVFVLGQLHLPSGLPAHRESWSVIWRPEFGLKFAKSKHIALVDQAFVDSYSTIQQTDKPANTSLPVTPEVTEGETGSVQTTPKLDQDIKQLAMTQTSRVWDNNTGKYLALATPVLRDKKSYLLATRDTSMVKTIDIGSVDLTFNSAKLSPSSLKVDPVSKIDEHLGSMPLRLSYKNYLTHLHNTIALYPPYIPSEDNQNRHYAWGEGTIGADGERGQDASTFILRLVKPFGLWLPRYSKDQTDKGMAMGFIAYSGPSALPEPLPLSDSLSISKLFSTVEPSFTSEPPPNPDNSLDTESVTSADVSESSANSEAIVTSESLSTLDEPTTSSESFATDHPTESPPAHSEPVTTPEPASASEPPAFPITLSTEHHYQAVLKHCKPGNFMSYGAGSNMACLGSISMSTLESLDPDAAQEARHSGGMSEEDKVPLVALSPVGLNSGGHWLITGKTAVYPIFKSGYYSSFIRADRELTFFSYFLPMAKGNNEKSQL